MHEQTDAAEQCDQCRFDSALWNDDDTVSTLKLAPELLREWSAPLDDESLNVRPAPSIWSVAEYIDHVRETFWGNRFMIDLALSDPGHDLGDGVEPRPAGAHRVLDFETSLDAVATEADEIWSTLQPIKADDWSKQVVFGGESRSVRSVSRHLVHDLWHHLTDIASIGAALGEPCPTHSGVIEQLNVSGGGVPKMPVASVEIEHRGIVGDSQNSRKHHGRPWQALCIWSSEVISELEVEGHPVAAGLAGENITIAGLEWSKLHSGAFLQIGEMTCQLSAPATPCSKVAPWFVDRDSSRIDHDRHPGFSRWYASVLTPGRVTTGDQATVGAQSF